MASWPSLIAEAFPAIGLEQLDAAPALRDRVDVKYVIPLDAFAALAERLRAPMPRSRSTAGAPSPTARPTSTRPSWARSATHMQQRRRRYKCRSREYCDSGVFAFEVKLKGPRGRTVKHRMAHEGHELSEAAMAFLRDA